MKKILFVSLVMLLGVSVAFSQFGIKGGINLANLRGDDKAFDVGNNTKLDPTKRLCLAGGISYRIGLIAGLSIQPEVMFIQKGAVYEMGISQASYSVNQKFTLKGDYIDIPMLVKFNLPIPVVSPYIEGGVSYGILLSAKAKEEVTSNAPGIPSSSEETDLKAEDLVAKNDFSIVIGVGVELLILDINARYMIGQKRVNKDNPATQRNEAEMNVYNQGIILTAGLRF